MTIEQLSESCIQNSKDIAALRESAKSAHKRIDENDRITEGQYGEMFSGKVSVGGAGGAGGSLGGSGFAAVDNNLQEVQV